MRSARPKRPPQTLINSTTGGGGTCFSLWWHSTQTQCSTGLCGRFSRWPGASSRFIGRHWMCLQWTDGFNSRTVCCHLVAIDQMAYKRCGPVCYSRWPIDNSLTSSKSRKLVIGCGQSRDRLAVNQPAFKHEKGRPVKWVVDSLSARHERPLGVQWTDWKQMTSWLDAERPVLAHPADTWSSYGRQQFRSLLASIICSSEGHHSIIWLPHRGRGTEQSIDVCQVPFPFQVSTSCIIQLRRPSSGRSVQLSLNFWPKRQALLSSPEFDSARLTLLLMQIWLILHN